MRSCGRSRRTRCSGPRSPPCRSLDGPVDADRFREKVDRASRTIPRLRQRVVGNPYSLAPPRWEVDPNFDLGYHLRSVSAGGDGTERDLLELAQWVGMQGFDRARPLWEMYLVDGMAEGRSALIQKLHHAITDGVGSIQIALSLFDLERDPGDPGSLPDAPDVEVLGSVDRLVDARRPTSAGAASAPCSAPWAPSPATSAASSATRSARPGSSRTPSGRSGACSPPPPSSSAR